MKSVGTFTDMKEWSPRNVNDKGNGPMEKEVSRRVERRNEGSLETNFQWNSLSKKNSYDLLSCGQEGSVGTEGMTRDKKKCSGQYSPHDTYTQTTDGEKDLTHKNSSP